MCLEDLKLGRGRYVGKNQNLTPFSFLQLNPDYRRVALMFNYCGFTTWDNAGNLVLNDSVDIAPVQGPISSALIRISMQNPQLILRIEDFGQLVQGPWRIVSNSGSGADRLSVIEIVTDVIAEAMGFPSVPAK